MRIHVAFLRSNRRLMPPRRACGEYGSSVSKKDASASTRPRAHLDEEIGVEGQSLVRHSVDDVSYTMLRDEGIVELLEGLFCLCIVADLYKGKETWFSVPDSI